MFVLKCQNITFDKNVQLFNTDVKFYFGFWFLLKGSDCAPTVGTKSTQVMERL